MKKRKIEIIVVITIIMVVMIVKTVAYRSFVDYEDTILSQQNNHILIIAKSISTNLKTYLEEKKTEVGSLSDNILLLEEDKDNKIEIERELELFLKYQNEMSNITYIDKNGNIIAGYPKNMSLILDEGINDKYFKRVKENKKYYISEVWRDITNELKIYMYYPILNDEEFEGVVVCVIDLEGIYEKIVKPINIGKKGYVTIKDKNGITLMHPEKESVGHDFFYLKNKFYRNLKEKEVEDLLKMELEKGEGTYISDSYLWKNDKDKNMYGFSSVIIGENSWIVSVVVSYKEMSESIINYFFTSLILSIAILLIIVWVLILFIKMIKNKEAYNLEKSYLKELNQTTKKLRKKEGELHHKRKIELIGALTGGIAHEFNSILVPIKDYSETILKNLKKDSELAEDVKIIYDSAKRSQEIIDQILTNDKKQIELNYKKISLNNLIKRLEKVIAPELPEKLDLKIRICKEEKSVFGNETQLYQVLINLIKNAINATKHKEIRKIEVDLCEEIVEEQKFAKIIVEDTGCGMTEETMENIFTPFYTKKLSKKSTGLGLYVVDEIIKNHNGSIKVSSKIKEGSKFELLLPLIKN